MTDRRYDACSIYVKATTADTVRNRLAELLGGRIERRSLLLARTVIDVRANPDAAAPSDGEDFVRWPVLVEISTDDTGAPSDRTMIDLVARVITDLWEADRPAVAACDFEEELPWRGGIERVNAAP